MNHEDIYADLYIDKKDEPAYIEIYNDHGTFKDTIPNPDFDWNKATGGASARPSRHSSMLDDLESARQKRTEHERLKAKYQVLESAPRYTTGNIIHVTFKGNGLSHSRRSNNSYSQLGECEEVIQNSDTKCQPGSNHEKDNNNLAVQSVTNRQKIDVQSVTKCQIKVDQSVTNRRRKGISNKQHRVITDSPTAAIRFLDELETLVKPSVRSRYGKKKDLTKLIRILDFIFEKFTRDPRQTDQFVEIHFTDIDLAFGKPKYALGQCCFDFLLVQHRNHAKFKNKAFSRTYSVNYYCFWAFIRFVTIRRVHKSDFGDHYLKHQPEYDTGNLDYSSAGRDFRLHHAIVSAKKTLRRPALLMAGYVQDVDIAGAMPNVIYEAYLKSGGSELQEVKTWLATHRARRDALMKRYKLDKGSAKLFYTLLFGLDRIEGNRDSIWFHKKNMRKIFRTQLDYEDALSYEAKLIAEIEQMRSIFDSEEGIKSTKSLYRDVYFNIEERLRTVFVDYISKLGCRSIIIHDGFALDIFLDADQLQELKQLTFEQTGFDVTYIAEDL